MIRTRANTGWLPLFGILLLVPGGCKRGIQPNEADVQSAQAHTLANEQHYAEALQVLRDVMRLNTDLGRDSVLGENYLLSGYCLRQLGLYDSALSHTAHAISLFNAIGEKKFERKGAIALADLYNAVGEFDSALLLASDVAGKAKILGDTSDTFAATSIIARANHGRGKYDDEISQLDELLKASNVGFEERSEFFDRRLRSCAAAGRYDQARATFIAWREYPVAQGSAALAYYEWGHIQQHTFNRSDSALRSFAQALSMVDEKAERTLLVNILSSLGGLAYRSRQFDEARRYFADALRAAQRLNDLVAEPVLQLMLVSCDWKTSRSDSAGLTQRCESVLNNTRQSGFRLGEAFAHFVQARITEKFSGLLAAMSLYRDAVVVFEQIPYSGEAANSVIELIDAFMDGEQLDWYDPLLRHYCASGNASEAFSLAEQKNLHELSQFFSRLTFINRDENISRAIANLQRRQGFLHLLDMDILSQLSAGKNKADERFDALTNLYSQRLREIATAADALGQRSPNHRRILHPRTVTLPEVQKALQPGTGVLEYVQSVDSLYAILIMPDSAFINSTVASRSHILSLVRDYNRSMSDASHDVPSFRTEELSKVLSDFLVEPILPLLGSVSTLYIVLPEEFGWLPCHTLQKDNDVLAARFSVRYLPTAAVLLFANEPPASIQTVAALGHPGNTGRDVEYELRDIRSFYDSASMFFSTTATLQSLMSAVVDLLHIAAPFTLDANMPDRSVFLLSDGRSQDGTAEVPLGQIFELQQVSVIVFSNLSPSPGEFWRYAPLALLANGSSIVIATMWEGDRKVKKSFGEFFYTRLRARLPAAQAYDEAIAELSREPEFSSLAQWGMYFWFGR